MTELTLSSICGNSVEVIHINGAKMPFCLKIACEIKNKLTSFSPRGQIMVQTEMSQQLPEFSIIGSCQPNLKSVVFNWIF